MRVGLVGLGRMGGNMALRLMQHGHGVVGYDQDASVVASLAGAGAQGAKSLEALVAGLEAPRTVWVMLPAGEATQSAIDTLARLLAEGDVVIDGGNTFWKDDLARARALAARGIHYIDVGTSGGIRGLEQGYCLMVGGETQIVARLMPLFNALATEGGFVHAGGPGSGHFVKMVHNAIEYGLMQAYAEGFDVLRHAGSEALPEEERLDLALAPIAEAWRHGSVIRSWLLDLAAEALGKDEDLARYTGVVADSGEGRWALAAAIEERVPAPVLAAALHARFRSQRERGGYADKLLSALRAGFGGHVEPAKD